MKKALNILKFVLLLVGVATLLPMLMGNVNNVDFILNYAYLLFAVAILSVVILTALNFGKGGGGSKYGMFVFGGLIVAVVVSYLLAGTTPVTIADGSVIDSVATLKLSDTLLYVTYAVFAAVVLLLIGGEIRNSIK